MELARRYDRSLGDRQGTDCRPEDEFPRGIIPDGIQFFGTVPMGPICPYGPRISDNVSDIWCPIWAGHQHQMGEPYGTRDALVGGADAQVPAALLAGPYGRHGRAVQITQGERAFPARPYGGFRTVASAALATSYRPATQFCSAARRWCRFAILKQYDGNRSLIVLGPASWGPSRPNCRAF